MPESLLTPAPVRAAHGPRDSKTACNASTVSHMERIRLFWDTDFEIHRRRQAMHVLMTGGTGLIGAATVTALKEKVQP